MEANPIKPITLKTDLPYFRRTWNRVVMLLLAVSFTPLILVGGLMYLYAATALKDKNIESLKAMVVSHQEMVDQYILERAADLKLAANALDPSGSESPDDRLARLHITMPSFMDLGLIDPDGRHLAYTGPYDLKRNNYKNAFWFKPALARDIYISDMFMGFRNVPHLIMTVRFKYGNRDGLIRGTLKATPFEGLVRALPVESGVDAYLVNHEGKYQTEPQSAGHIMETSGLMGLQPHQGIELVERDGQILAMTWLKQAPWMLVAHIDKRSFSAPLNRVRKVGWLVFLLGSLLIIPTVLLTTNYLVANLEQTWRGLNVLNEHLMRHAYAASALKYTTRIMENLKTGLINVKTALIPHQGPTGPEASGPGLDQLEKSLATIDRLALAVSPVERNFIIRDIDIKRLLDEAIDILIDGLLAGSIVVKRVYPQGPVMVRTELGRTRRMFHELIIVFLELINHQGDITFETGTTGTSVFVKIQPGNRLLPANAPNYRHWFLESTILQDIYSSNVDERNRLWTQNLSMVKSETGIYFLVEFHPPAGVG